MSIETLLQTAVQLHRTGRLVEAERGYQEILRRSPRNIDGLHLLGVLKSQQGNFAEAEQLIDSAIRLKPDFREAIANLGKIYLDQLKFLQAVELYKKVVTLAPNDASAHFELGIAFRIGGDESAAMAAFQVAARLNPRAVEVHLEIGKIYRRMGDLDRAMASYAQAVNLQPACADAYNNIGNIHLQRGNVEESLQYIAHALTLDPQSALFHSNLGEALRHASRRDEAMIAYNAALRIKPGFSLAMVGRGNLLADLCRFTEALETHRAVVAAVPHDALAQQSLGNTLATMGDTEAAIPFFRRAVELEPKTADFWNRLGAALESIGRFDDAEDCFRRALDARPNDPMASRNLMSRKRSASESEISRLAKILDDPLLPPLERAAAGFGLGKLFDDTDQYDLAFPRYQDANQAIKQLKCSEQIVFSAGELGLHVDMLIDRCTDKFFKDREAWGDNTELPVFIVGMPRSGTTLVEQICASHSQVHGAGELPDMPAYMAELGSDPAGWQQSSFAAKRALYKTRLISQKGNVERTIDKTPGNIFSLTLIALMFPNARVIFCQRDPRDNCLSCYFQWFAKSNLMFSYDLADCATQYLEQKRLTEHWLKVLPLRMHAVQYEELVADLEGQSRRLIDFLGLPWETSCLDFHKTQRTVLTASVWQVRQPIYNSSVGRWKHYEKHLGPLLNALVDPRGTSLFPLAPDSAGVFTPAERGANG